MKIDETVIEEELVTLTASVTPELREAGFYAPECTAPPGASARAEAGRLHWPERETPPLLDISARAICVLGRVFAEA